MSRQQQSSSLSDEIQEEKMGISALDKPEFAALFFRPSGGQASLPIWWVLSNWTAR